MNLKKEVFMFSKWGKLLSALETFIVLIVFSLSAIYGLSLLDGSIKEAHMFKSLVITMVTFSLIISFLFMFTVKDPILWVLWRVLPMNRKTTVAYLKDRQQKLEEKVADSDNYLKQLSDDYHDAILEHSQRLEKVKKEIEELKDFLTVYG